jgi:flagellum-specific peptidoglycan hydrolase FlgJ
MRIILIIFLLFTFLTVNNYNCKYIIIEHNKLTIKNVERELLKQEILFPEIVLKQVKLETGHLKYVPNNNLFGFRTNSGYLKFNTWQDAVTYAKKWQLRKYRGGDYYIFLTKVGYAKDPNYIKKLKQI